ncbi:DUF4439 domain-containing protein [Arthrobacter sp. CAN_A1]|uniref:DUF4439 domain-containing protein n=1 Tax=Arthrobacter sp. CAN_A1 TaxID=2787717 RepID=UPI0018CA0461
MKDSAAPRRSGSPGAVRTVARRTIRTLALLLAFTLVIALGLNLDGPPPEGPPVLTLTEEAQLAAEARASDLAAAATVLADIAPSAAPGSDLGPAYTEAAGLLQTQADALRHPILSAPVHTDPPAGGADGLPSSEPSDGSSAGASLPAEPAPTPSGFVADLFSSAQQNLDAAVTVEPGIARLLASVGTSQRHQARILARLQDLEVLPPAELPAAPVESPPDCAATPVDSAETDWLAEAVAAEYQSAYAYEVTAARAPDPASLLTLAGQHTAAAAEGEALLDTVVCTASPPRIPAFALDPGFVADPAATLAGLETSLVGMYADLVGLTDGTARQWAIQRFAAVTDHRHSTTDVVEAFPGITE